MTSPEPNSTALSGEARLRQRSRRIRNIWIGALGFAFIAGAGFGLAEGSGTLQLSPLVFWLILAALAAGVVAVNVWFMRGVAMNSALTPFQVFNFRCLSLIPGKLLKSVLVRRIGGKA